MSGLRYRLIVNPAAGKGNAERSIPRIRALLDAASVEYTLVKTERPWHAAELADEATRDGIDVVVAVGGDGTANEVLNGLMRAQSAGFTGSALGVLCVGRGNDFAFGVGIPNELDSGCRALIEARRRVIDVGQVSGGLYPDGRYFGNGVGIGFDAVVGFVAKELKHVSGFAGYLVGALKTIFLYFHAPTLKLVMDAETIEMNALMVSVMNGRRMGGGFMMAPNGDPNDGKLDLCLVREVSRPGIFRLIPRFLKGSQFGHPAVRSEQTAHLGVRALSGVLPAHADGETICTDGTALDIEILPAALQILVSSEGAL